MRDRKDLPGEAIAQQVAGIGGGTGVDALISLLSQTERWTADTGVRGPVRCVQMWQGNAPTLKILPYDLVLPATRTQSYLSRYKKSNRRRT